jgi:hypothetical protein
MVSLSAKYRLLAGKVIDYVVGRQNQDGGYNFVEGDDSNANDTYYGLATLDLLGVSFPRVDKTIKWLRDFKLGTFYSYYFIGKALSLCNQPLGENFRSYVESAIASKKQFASVDVYFEVASEFRAACMILELAELLEIHGGDDITRWILKYKNEDGGFGVHRHSNMNSTYYATACLDLLDFDATKLPETVEFLRACEKSHGGFTVIPASYAPYMEYTYYGVMALDIFRERCRFPSQTISFVQDCRNANGGFARAELGISTFENTFQAVSVLLKLAENT